MVEKKTPRDRETAERQKISAGLSRSGRRSLLTMRPAARTVEVL